MDLLTGLMLLWGLSKARPAPPPTRAPLHSGTPAWPEPASPPPARPAKRPKRRPRPAPARPAPRQVARPAPSPAAQVAPAAPAPAVAPPAVYTAPAPAVAPPPVHTSLPVRDIQVILNNLGAGLKVDNLFGPKTGGAWRKAALSRDLPAYIARVAPQRVEVTTYTLDRLRAESGTVVGIYIP